MTPSYCTQNNGDCLSCNLSGSDGVDCQGNDFFICLDDYLEESCGSTLLTTRTSETCLTNPTDTVIHDLTPLDMVKIPVSRLRQLEYIEKHLSSIIQSAVHDSVT